MNTKNNSKRQIGIVYKKISNHLQIRSGEYHTTCTPLPALASTPAVIGDRVEWIETEPGVGLVVNILPRSNQLARQRQTLEQVMAANLDLVVPVFAAAKPTPSWNMLDRYLVIAEAAGLSSIICITKMDLCPTHNGQPDPRWQEIIDDYRRIGYPVILTSANRTEGLQTFNQALQGRVSIMVGKSGAGKTSLLNALQPELELRVNELSHSSGKGKHTTTHYEMFPLSGSGELIDTPGMRELSLWNIDDQDLAYFFPEMRPFIGRCKFRLDCRHDEEPGCAIRQAVCSGQISPRRYQSYMRMKGN